MPKIFNPSDLPSAESGEGWQVQTLANHESFEASAMLSKKWTLEPNATGPLIGHQGVEEMLYVVRGSGTAVVAEERMPLEPETMLWIEAGDEYYLESGPDGLEVLHGVAPGE